MKGFTKMFNVSESTIKDIVNNKSYVQKNNSNQ